MSLGVYIKNIDKFHRNVIFVFLGSSVVSVFNLLYQLLVAHKLNPSDFASLNSLIAIFTVISSPLGTFQTAIAHHTAVLNSRKRIERIRDVFSQLFLLFVFFAAVTFVIISFTNKFTLSGLKISSNSCGYLLSWLVALSWISPLLNGYLQGLERFGWMVFISVLSGAAKLVLAVIFIYFGFNIAGGLGAFLAGLAISIMLSIFPLKKFFIFVKLIVWEEVGKIFVSILPIAVSILCFNVLVNSDMVLVKYFFSSQESGFYSLSQMVGKIFLFLPAAISVVMFPKTAGLFANNLDTKEILKKSLLFGMILCAIGILVYNLFPQFVLKILVGKVYPESIILGRFFSISMSLFALLNILIFYFISIKDFRFIGFLVFLTIMQVLAISVFHAELLAIQIILCINAVLLFIVHTILAYKP